jgi:glucose 1-dehydrogenase
MQKRTLDGQVAVISGGLGDIGRAVGRKLAALGADIAVGDILDATHASSHLAEIATLERRSHYTAVDISDSKAVEQWIEDVETTVGIPTLIICNAAIVSIANSLTIDTDEWARTLHVNLDGAFFLARAAAARLVKHQIPGRIVFMGSWAAHTPHPQIVAYSVAKAGLRMLCKCMALELAKHDILVNEVAPGYVDGGLVRRWYSEDPTLRGRDSGRVPLQRLIHPDEVALEVSHLCDPANRHMTGSVVLMDGGLSLVAPGQPE